MALPMIMHEGLVPGGLKSGSRSMNHYAGFPFGGRRPLQGRYQHLLGC
jgi:hypothetical protein